MKSTFCISLFWFTLFISQVNETKALFYDQLSNQFDIEVAIRINATQNPDLDATYLRIRIFEKGSKTILQTIRKPRHWLFDTFYTDKSHSRSYSTNYNSDIPVVDDNFGDIVVADLNFDGRDDFAVTYDHGADNGNHYYFYFQRPNKTFYRQVFLTEKMIHFPTDIDPVNKRITTRTTAGAFGVGVRTFQYNEVKNSWRILSQRTIEF